MRLTIREYCAEIWWYGITDHNKFATISALSCKLHVFCVWKCVAIFSSLYYYYVLYMHFPWFQWFIIFYTCSLYVLFAMSCSLPVNWRWAQSREACLKYYCDAFDRDRCMNSLTEWWMSIPGIHVGPVNTTIVGGRPVEHYVRPSFTVSRISRRNFSWSSHYSKVYQGIEWFSQLAGLQWLRISSILIIFNREI